MGQILFLQNLDKMIDLTKIKEKALLATVITRKIGAHDFKAEEEAAELKELAKTSGVDIISEIIIHCDELNPKFFIGKGKAEELSAIVFNEKINVVMFSVGLSGTQARNLEKELDCKVIDRMQLILDIFAQHARSPEGKMQVELAQLEYLAPRLAGRGSGLSGLGGGVGTRGPGEQKLELDRRRMRTRITRLKSELEKSRTQSRLIRKKRREENVPSVVLVGYTNAGKTTLLNSLCAEHQLAEDSLFTTLDTLSRTVILPDHQRVVLSDTVGFLHNLPHNLIAAFKATLEDVKDADLLIHVLDVSSSLRYNYYESVIAVLGDLGCLEKPMITVLNKVDKLENLEWLERYKSDFTSPVVLSALKRENLAGLLAEIDVKVSRVNQEVKITLPLAKMNLVDLIYREGKVKKVRYTSKSVILEASIPETLRSKIEEYIK